MTDTVHRRGDGPAAERRRALAVVVKVVLAALGVGTAWASVQLGVGSPAEPGPGLWPLIVSVLLVLSVLVIAVGERGAEVEAATPRSRLTVLALASLVLFAVGFAAVGFTVPALVLLVLWFRWLGREPWWLSLLLAVVCVGVLYLIFAVALGVPFPPDLLIPTS